MNKAIIIGVLGVTLLAGTVVVSGNSSTPEVSTTLINVPQLGGTETSSKPGSQEGTVVPTTVSVTKISVDSSAVLKFNVPVVTESVDIAIDFLSKSTADKIYLELDSPGGSVVDGARLIEYIKHSKKNIYTVCNNFCASMAFHIFQTGKERLLVDKAILMAHPASGGAQGTLENMSEQLKMFRLYVDRMDADVAKRAKIDYSVFKTMVANNLWVETPEALALSLADKVVHLEVNYSGFSGDRESVTDVMQIMRDKKLWNDRISNIKGYQFILK